MDPLGPRSYSPPSRPMEFLVIKLLARWRSPISVYSHSSHSLVLSDFDGSPYQPGVWENIDQPQYVRRNELLVPLSENDIPSYLSIKKTLQPRVPSGAPQNTTPRSSVRHLSRNGQARRRSVEPPGSNTMVCLDFVFKTFIFHKLLLYVMTY